MGYAVCFETLGSPTIKLEHLKPRNPQLTSGVLPLLFRALGCWEGFEFRFSKGFRPGVDGSREIETCIKARL